MREPIGAKGIKIKVVAVFPIKLTNLKECRGVKILDDNGGCTVVTCWQENGTAKIPDEIGKLPEIAGRKRKDKWLIQPAPAPTFALTGIEKSAVKNIHGKRYPDWAVIPVLPDGSAPTGSVPKDVESYSGKPVAFVNHLPEMVIINVSDFYDQPNKTNIDYISAVRFSINQKTGAITRQEICDKSPVNLGDSDWAEQIETAVGKKFAKAAEVACDLAWGMPGNKDKCPAWVIPEEPKPQPTKAEKSAPARKTTAKKSTAKTKADDDDGNGKIGEEAKVAIKAD